MAEQLTLRRQLRLARQGLTQHERIRAAAEALARISKLSRYTKANYLALYVGAGGELCPMPLADHAASLHKTVCLPVLHPFRAGRLLFCAWKAGEPLQLNRFGIAEPVPTARNLVSPRRLDLVVTPLLGFDEQANRLGMGGGYYDRTFAFRRRHPCLRRPFMLGLAHEVQKTAAIATQPWDVPLDAVVTNKAVYQPNGSAKRNADNLITDRS